MHILHLLDPAHCGDEALLACHNLTRGGDADPTIHHDFWLIGNAADERRAWSVGIPTTDRIQPRAFDGARVGIKRLIRARSSRPDIIHCWSLPTLLLARAAFGDSADDPARIAVLSHAPTGLPTSAAAGDEWTRREIICTFDLFARASLAPLLNISLEENRWAPPIRLIEPPAFPPGGPFPQDRTALRAALNLEPTDIAVACLADPPTSLDAMSATFAAGVLRAIGHRAVVLIRRGLGAAKHERRAVAYTRSHAHRWGMILADCSLPELLAAADVALIDRTGASPNAPAPTAGPIAASLALSMGVPIVSAFGLFAASPSAAGEPWPIYVAASHHPGRTAVPLANILANAPLRIQLAASARAWCDRARARNGFRTSLNRIWTELSTGVFDPEPILARDEAGLAAESRG